MSVTGKVPIRDPLGLRGDIITNPQWIKWLTEQLAPAIVAINLAGLSPENLLIYRAPLGLAQTQAAADSASIAASLRRQSAADSFPLTMRTPQQRTADLLPPIYQRVAARESLMPGMVQKASPAWLLSDTHANRAKYPAGSYSTETAFFETDRGVTYRSGGTAWVYSAGTMIDTAANRPADLGANDANFRFLASDTLAQSYWTGAAWVTFGSAAGSTGAWTPALKLGGSGVGITYLSQSGEYFRIGTLVVATFDFILTSKGVAIGDAEIDGLPVNLSALEVTGGAIQYCDNMLLLTSLPSIQPEIGTPRASLFNCGATGSTTLTDANFTNTSRMIGTAIYST